MTDKSINRRAGDNCLNLIRIVAAFQVMFGHMIEHLKLPINSSVLKCTYFFRGVPIFFVISGYLMWFSIGRSNMYSQYLKKRFWRIYPELWVAIIVEIVVLLILYSGREATDIILFAFSQGTIFQFWTPDSLRGYGVGTPNGALWTIGVMIQFYIIAWFFYRLMKKKKLIIWIAGFIIAFTISWAGRYATHSLLGRDVIEKLYDQTFFEYLWLFYIGMFIAEFKDKLLPILQKYWYAFLLIAFFFFWAEWDLFSGYYLFWSLFLTVGLIGFAYRFPQFSVNLDISYGLFLYHMTVINVFVNFGWTGNWLYVVPVVLVAIFLAYLSTVTVGRISARIKCKLA